MDSLRKIVLYMRIPGLMMMIVLTMVLSSCRRDSPFTSQGRSHTAAPDLEEIRERGRIIALTDYNSTNYFIYRGEPMGYQYELLRALCDHMEIKLEVLVENDLGEAFNSLLTGRCDLIAKNLTVTRERSQRVYFTYPVGQTRQVLVQRKPRNWRMLHPFAVEEQLIRNQLDLAGKTIYVQRNSAFARRLHSLADEIGDSINIVEVPQEAEKLISLVAHGEIDYTVSDENVALVNQTYYSNIDVFTAISFPQNLAWALRKDARKLQHEIDIWLSVFKKTTRYALIYNKYFRNQKSADIVRSDYFTLSSGKISPWDDDLRKYSTLINWDWRLLASLIYQESRFDPTVESWAGAFGLMQLMPSTAARYGVTRHSLPEKNIEAGVKFIRWLDTIFADKVKEPGERIKFVLAAYNVGVGHVLDARKLAVKYGKEPDLWDGHVDYYLLNKSDPEYYNDPVVEYGYCRGEEPYRFVLDILDRYEHYMNITMESGFPAAQVSQETR